MIWYDDMIYDMIWWYDMIWYDMIWHDIHYVHYMFQPVIAAISRECYNYVTRKNWGRYHSFTIKIHAYNSVIIPNNGIKNCISIK